MPRGLRWKAEIHAPGSVGLAFLLLYLLTWDRVGQYDAVLSASIVELWRPDQGLSLLFPFNHFLFEPVALVLHRLLSLLPLGLDGYRTLQLMSSLCGAFILYGLTRVLGRRTGAYGRSALGAALLGVTASFWTGAVGGLAYLAGAAAVLAALWALEGYLRAPSTGGLRRVSMWAVLPAYVHTGNVVLLPPFLWALVKGTPGPKGPTLLRTLGTWAVAGLPYLLVQRLYSPDQWGHWWALGSSSLVWYSSSLKESSWRLDPGDSLGRAWRTFWASGIPRLELSSVLLLSSAFGTLLIGSRRGPWRGLAGPSGLRPAAVPEAPRRGLAGPSGLRTAAVPEAPRRGLWFQTLLASLLLYLAFYTLWQPDNAYYWCTHWMLLTMVLLACGPWEGSPAQRKGLLAAGLVGFVGIGSWNLTERILPKTREESSPLVYFSQRLRDATPGGSVILVSGLRWGDLKVYVPYFGRRNRLALDLFLREFPKEAALERLRRDLSAVAATGRALFATSDIWDPEVREELQRNWGLAPEEVDRVLEPYDPRPAMKFAPESFPRPLVLYRLVPKSDKGGAVHSRPSL